MYKQIIIVRKDLNLSVGKICSQVSHASMAFLSNMIRDNTKKSDLTDLNDLDSYDYETNLTIDKDLYENWFNDIFTKIVLKAKNKNDLLKAVKIAEELGMKENEDFFLIHDACKTELEPEEFDENGIGRCLTCVGFKPMDSEIIDKIAKKYQLYK